MNVCYRDRERERQSCKYRLVWFVGLYGISTLVGYLTPNLFLVNSQFFFKQFSLAGVHSLIVKNISISNYSSSYI